MAVRVAVVTTDVFVRRLTPALASCVKGQTDFRIIDIQRPMRELLALLRRHQPAGIITEWLPRITDRVVALGLPTVVADTDVTYPGVVSLDVDDAKVGETAARFFAESGYRHFACVTSQMPYATQRLEGFRRYLARQGWGCESFLHQEPASRHYMESWTEPTAKLRAWIERLPRPVGVFAVHDPLGRLVCEVAGERRSIPEEVAVVGANNDELVCGLSHPPLSSIIIPWDRIGALAGEWIQRLMEGQAAPRRPLLIEPGPVVARQSTTLLAVEDRELRRVLRYMRDHHVEPLTVERICMELRVSRRSVERRFQQVLRVSPWEMLCRLRVESAKRLLAETGLPMGQVAERCGFGHAERFSVVFRRLTGRAPSAYRSATRAAGG